jgi:hypothetical protein
MKKIRIWVYIPVVVVTFYLTILVMATTEVEEFEFGFIDFSKNEINNYSSLISVIVGLFGVVLLVETLWLQYRQFKADEKAKQRDEKLDWYYKLSLLNIDLESIIKDVNTKAEKIKEYFESEKNNPFKTNLLFRTPSRNYTRILELDRLSIYKGFYNFFGHNEDWLNKFNKLYSILDFLPEIFREIYSMYDNHSKDIFKKKSEVQQGLMEVMNLGSNLLTAYKAEFSIDKYLVQPASRITNEMIFKYHELIKESYDEDGNVIAETNLKRIGDDVLFPFIQQVLEQRENIDTFDRRLEQLSEFSSNLRKQIYQIQERSIEFATNVETQYKSLIVSLENNKATIDEISEIKDFISEELSKIDKDSF